MYFFTAPAPRKLRSHALFQCCGGVLSESLSRCSLLSVSCGLWPPKDSGSINFKNLVIFSLHMFSCACESDYMLFMSDLIYSAYDFNLGALESGCASLKGYIAGNLIPNLRSS